jgi:hypothetical protein
MDERPRLDQVDFAFVVVEEGEDGLSLLQIRQRLIFPERTGYNRSFVV